MINTLLARGPQESYPIRRQVWPAGRKKNRKYIFFLNTRKVINKLLARGPQESQSIRTLVWPAGRKKNRKYIFFLNTRKVINKLLARGPQESQSIRTLVWPAGRKNRNSATKNVLISGKCSFGYGGLFYECVGV